MSDLWAGPRAGGSVFNRLRLLLATVFLVGSTIALTAAWLFSNTAADEAFDQLMVSAAVQIAETLDVEQGHAVVAPPDAAFETLALAGDDRIFYSVWGPDGRLLTGYAALKPADARPTVAAPRTANARILDNAIRTVTLGHYIAGDGVRGWSTVVVGQTRNARRALAWRLMAKTSLLVISIGLLGFVSSLAAARRALRPLARIEEALALRQPHDVTPLDVKSPRETLALVEAINAVMTRLAEHMAKLQQFAAVAAHQIRTPLAALTAQLELLDADTSPAARRARVERLRLRVGELARLTNQLLGHAMIVYRRDLHARERVDLTALARSACDNSVPLSLARDLSIVFKAPREPVTVAADPLGLREALTNVIHNAVTHGAVSRLEVRVEADGETARVVVFDDGPGIRPEDWDAVLSPFTAVRSGGNGAGLGLSIVRDVVEAHGGQVVFDNLADGGFEVGLILPRRRDAA
jgi:two-component system sensor histidine kinase TctE